MQYGYDPSGNRLYVDNRILANLSGLYLYDGLGRLSEFDIGTLNVSRTAITTPLSGGANHVFYGRDSQGNWTHGKDSSGVWVARTQQYNEDNAVRDGGTSDGAGNTTSLGVNVFPSGMTGQYDAWGRLIEAEIDEADGESHHRYDALGREISLVEHASNVTIGTCNTSREYYVDVSGNVLEEQYAGTVDAQYIWSPQGQMILRDRDSDHSGDLDERLYALYDPQGSITAVADRDGNVVERYLYDGTGNAQVLTPTGGQVPLAPPVNATSDYLLGAYFVRPQNSFLGSVTGILGGTTVSWGHFFQGMRYDRVSGLYTSDGQAFNPRVDRCMSPSLPEKREGTNAYRSWADGPESSWWDYVPGVSSFRGAMWDWEHGRFGWAVFEAGTGIADISLTVLSLGTAALAKQGGRMVSQNALHEATLQQVGRSMARMAIREAAIGGAAGTVMGGGLGYYQAGWGGMWRGAGNGLLHGAVSGAALSPFAWAANRAHSANRMLTLPASMDAELEAYQIAAREGRLVRVRTSALPRSNARTIWESRWGRIPQGYDVDHIIQRQHGGTTELSNLQLKLSGLNRSEGVSARWLMGNDRYGTVYTRVRLNRQP